MSRRRQLRCISYRNGLGFWFVGWLVGWFGPVWDSVDAMHSLRSQEGWNDEQMMMMMTMDGVVVVEVLLAADCFYTKDEVQRRPACFVYLILYLCLLLTWLTSPSNLNSISKSRSRFELMKLMKSFDWSRCRRESVKVALHLLRCGCWAGM